MRNPLRGIGSWSAGALQFEERLKAEPQNIECPMSNVEGKTL